MKKAHVTYQWYKVTDTVQQHEEKTAFWTQRVLHRRNMTLFKIVYNYKGQEDSALDLRLATSLMKDLKWDRLNIRS